MNGFNKNVNLQPNDAEASKQLHLRSDLNTGPQAQHHTLGIGKFQAASGDHSHDVESGKVLFETAPKDASVSWTAYPVGLSTMNIALEADWPEPYGVALTVIVNEHRSWQLYVSKTNSRQYLRSVSAGTWSDFKLMAYQPNEKGASSATNLYTNRVMEITHSSATPPAYLVIHTNITHQTNTMTQVNLKGFVYLDPTSDLDVSINFYSFNPNIVSRGVTNKGTFPITFARYGVNAQNKITIVLSSTSPWAFVKAGVDALVGHAGSAREQTFEEFWSFEFVADWLTLGLTSVITPVIKSATYT